MLMHNPPHPGEVIRELCLEPLGLSVTAAAEALGPVFASCALQACRSGLACTRARVAPAAQHVILATASTEYDFFTRASSLC